MKILKREPTLWRLRIESEDDLWTLSHLARQGLHLGMLGERRDQTTSGEEGGRAKVAERKKMWIRLSIATTEYQPFSDLLRVHGIIDEAKFDIGLHHTHVIEVRDEVELSASTAFSQADMIFCANPKRHHSRSISPWRWWKLTKLCCSILPQEDSKKARHGPCAEEENAVISSNLLALQQPSEQMSSKR